MKTITRGEYYTLHGLLKLAKEHGDALNVIERTAGTMLGETDDLGYFGHVSDAVSERSIDADELLRKLNIEVVDG